MRPATSVFKILRAWLAIIPLKDPFKSCWVNEKLFKQYQNHYLFSATNGTNEHELFVSIGVIRGKKFDNWLCIANS